MPEKETLENLYSKYLNNEISLEELEQFLQELDSENGERIVAKMMDGTWEEMYETARPKVIPLTKRTWFRVAVAAVVILFVAAGGYLMLNRPTQREIVQNKTSQPKNDITPGGNKAILTLADGTKVILDSANTGAISKQGNVTVIKLNDGLLSYEEQKSNDIQVVYNTITTPRGGQYQLVLADGSKVWLNAASSIRFPNAFPGNDRKVEITGEAYFEVAHNEKKPFRVSVNKIEVQVLGTHFNINAYEDESTLKTTLLQGSVKVSEGKENVLIKPGEQVEVSTLDDRLVINKNVDLAEVMAWKNGRFDFSDADIKSVMRQLARWYNFNVEFKGEIKDRFHVEMTRNTNLSNVFRILEGTGGVHFEIESNKVLVMP